MTFRAWTYADIYAIAALEKECFSDAWTFRMLADSFFSESAMTLLAEEGGEILGYAVFSVLFEEAELADIAVSPAARRRGIPCGAYHFFSPTSKASEQASYFLRNSKFSKGDLPPVLDVEPTPSQVRKMGGTEAMLSRVRTWMSIVHKRTGVRPILYVSQQFVNKYLPSAPDITRDYKVWIARYGEYRPDVRLAIWQLCPDGRVSGIVGEVDINVFNGYHDDFKKFLKTETVK